jgi:hypothetical protein
MVVICRQWNDTNISHDKDSCFILQYYFPKYIW